ncbi:uncharacterized protein Fancm [Epargyreus clarus]|uniref:uncharacterized protein Fancm n=1 Tax=Epargyreus clarus TaxID=520877 RepID=UPI003C2BA797
MNIAEQSNKEINDDVDLFDDSLLAAFDTSDFKESSSSKRQDTGLNTSIDHDNSVLNVSALCCDEEFSGYDKLTGRKWIYPNNYPVRDYQFNIIKAAILKNTLVSLPTGLGKTFIAAVLMYNFYRWYPMGKIVFTAPTRPLIAQQIEACYNIIAIPPDDTIEMTGNMNATLRKENWESKRVFFATPQVVANDIKSGICPGKLIRCLVIDEAHKAKNNYAYCHIVSMLNDMQHRTYRILALSATPGSRINDVVQVVKNLQIAHLELRTENCIDVAKYCYSRNIKTVVVPLGPELSRLRQEYIEILDIYARKLKQMNILKSNAGNLSKGRILMIYKEYQTNSIRHPQRSYIMKDLSQLISLYHGLELLVSHGSRSFLNFFDEHPEKMWIQSDDRLTVLLERLRDDLGINPLNLNTNVLPDGTIPEIPKYLTFGHPKFDKVKEIMLHHFQTAKENNEDTRAIVFCEYHETVKLVHCLLLQCRPLILARTFVGQGAPGKGGRAAMSQKQQLRAMAQFRAGACNALVATCVAEEGLDVGSVDLIVCFDVATRSPVRLVQRCGRTGRERSGQVHFLVTEGKEHQTLLDGMRQRDSLKTKILHSKEVQENLYKLNPRMLPYDVTPKCDQIYVTVKKQTAKGGQRRLQGEAKSKKNKKEKQVAQNPTTASTSNSTEIVEDIPGNLNINTYFRFANKIINSPSKEPNKGPGLITRFLSPKKEDSKETNRASIKPCKLNAVSSQSANNKRQKIQSKLAGKSTKKNCDIRALLIPKKKPDQNSVKLFNKILDENKDMSTKMFELYFHLKTENEETTNCYTCENTPDICKDIQKLRKKHRNNNYTPMLLFQDESAFPDLTIVDDIDAESIKNYAKQLEEKYKVNSLQEAQKNNVYHNNIYNSKTQTDDANDGYFDDESHELYNLHNYDIEVEENISLHEENKNKLQNDVHVSKPQNDVVSKTCINDEPHALSNLHSFDIGDPEDITVQEENETNSDLQNDVYVLKKENVDSNKKSFENASRELSFYIGDVDDIFAVSPQREEETERNETKCENVTGAQWTCSNFDLGGIDDILEINDEENKIDVRSTGIKEDKDVLCSDIPITKPTRIGREENQKDYTNEMFDRKSPILNKDFSNRDIPTIDLSYDGSQEHQKDCIREKSNRSSPVLNNKGLLHKDIPTVDLSCDGSQGHPKDFTKETLDKQSPILKKEYKNRVCDIIDLSFDEESDNKKVSQKQHLQSPSILSRTRPNLTLKSPILTSQARKLKLKRNLKLNRNSASTAKKQLNLDSNDSTSNEPDSDSSMLTESQIIDLINSNNDSHSLTIRDEDTRRVSPILLTQAERNKDTSVTENNRSIRKTPEHVFANISLLNSSFDQQVTNKRKVDDETIASPYFNKKQKYDHQIEQVCNTIKTKIFGALKSYNINFDNSLPNDTAKNNSISGPKLIQNNNTLLKENQVKNDNQVFNLAERFSYTPKKPQDMTTWSKTKRNKTKNKDPKKEKISAFIDLEASLSGDDCGSGDELTDDSIGSIKDFVTDKDATFTEEDMQAHYLKSVKSPLKIGAFKMPLARKHFTTNVLSQFSQQDSYEMDSFCVDSNMDITEAKDLSELEIAEMILEKQQKRRKKSRIKEPVPYVNGNSSTIHTVHEDGDSPIIKRKNKARFVTIDSDDSS